MRTSWVPDRDTNPERRGFSLIELLVVIAIIALIISIILPVLGGARKAGRKVATQGVLNDISGASGQFKLANKGRNPGYFSAREMGSVENLNRGMSEMENVMLDLAGPSAIKSTAGPNTVEVGPLAAATILVDPSLIGADKGAYFTPSGEYYQAMLSSNGQQISDVPGHAGSSETDIQLLDVVDAFGQPILFWSADDYTVKEVTLASEFAARDSSSLPAMFYWNTNAAFLAATSLGKKGEDMTVAPASGTKASLIGQGAIDNSIANTMLSMQALLGSPSAPRVPAGQTVEDVLASPSVGSMELLFPGRPKGPFVIQSAGIDGVYLSTKDRGFAAVAHADDHIEFGLDFFISPTARVTDDDNRNTSRDVTSEFDEIVVSGGG
jgi:prepilin-type N-terminal cleavage/methylation domain-containing protein